MRARFVNKSKSLKYRILSYIIYNKIGFYILFQNRAVNCFLIVESSLESPEKTLIPIEVTGDEISYLVGAYLPA